LLRSATSHLGDQTGRPADAPVLIGVRRDEGPPHEPLGEQNSGSLEATAIERRIEVREVAPDVRHSNKRVAGCVDDGPADTCTKIEKKLSDPLTSAADTIRSPQKASSGRASHPDRPVCVHQGDQRELKRRQRDLSVGLQDASDTKEPNAQCG
jgi:hypothetical protein